MTRIAQEAVRTNISLGFAGRPTMSIKHKAVRDNRFSVPLAIGLVLICSLSIRAEGVKQEQRKNYYVDAVTQGEGFMPWQEKGVSEAEAAFRDEIEGRKDEMIETPSKISHPVMLTREQIEQARRNIESSEAASKWFAGQKSTADYIVQQSRDYVEQMIEELTPTHGYGFTCPNCVGQKSQECMGHSLIGWNYREPDVIHCRRCGQIYPDPKYPETATVICPRMDQEFTYYINEEERNHPEDRSGEYAWHWVGHPMHISFSGIIRAEKNSYMLSAVRSLAISYGITEDPRYAEKAVQILVRLAHCYRNWLYHDYWDGIADCDPMYAAWHDRALPLLWKKHLCTEVFAKDTIDRAAMLQTYWGAGRFHPSTDSVSNLAGICLAYDLIYNAKDSGGVSLWTPELRSKVERDLILEWGIGAEPFVGGRNEATNANNKAPRIYNAQAAIGKCLGIPELADTALRGYQTVRDKSFNYDGFSTESPAYTNMYLGQLLEIPETLDGFHWPQGFTTRSGVVDLYGTDPKLRLMYQSIVDQLQPNGRYLPLSDTNERSSPSSTIIQLGLKHYPKYYDKRLPESLRHISPSEYSIFHFNLNQVNMGTRFDLPEIYYPAWMTSILRHGKGPEATVLSLVFNPPGGHRHYDNLALYYSDGGATILGDHGYVGDMPVNHWIKSTFSHNLVVVDDQGQRHDGDHPRKPRLRMMATSPKISLVEASSDTYSQCSEYRRLVALIKGPGAQTFAVDIFRIAGGNKHSYRIFSELASSDNEQGNLLFSGISMPNEEPLPKVGASLEHDDIFGLRDIRAADDPLDSWQAIWAQPERRYRLWMLTGANRIEASNGPGQRTLEEAGRRVRYVDVIREGENIASTFVAVHEPSFPNRSMPVKQVQRLKIPDEAGPNAVALRIESAWGTYLLFSDFARETEVEGVRFEGRFGLVCDTPQGETWSFALGTKTLQRNDLGFTNKTPDWTGNIKENTDSMIVTTSSKPADWVDMEDNFTSYLVADDGRYITGFPVISVEVNRIHATRFSLPELKQFELPALRYMSLSR
ncbi:MAG: heparinase II/III family protein [bacterium]